MSETAAMRDTASRDPMALVLGGGVAGIAWEIGLSGWLAPLGIDLAPGADLVVACASGPP